MTTFIKVGTIHDVAPDRPLVYDFAYDTVVIFQVGDEYFCLEDLCSHQDYPLSEGSVEGSVADCRVLCPLHGSWFALRTGQALNLPAVKAVRTFAIKLDGEDILVAEPETAW
jgi:3-phenylpropionate/trans-cinnamate dioxygenase ferredoxin component